MTMCRCDAMNGRNHRGSWLLTSFYSLAVTFTSFRLSFALPRPQLNPADQGAYYSFWDARYSNQETHTSQSSEFLSALPIQELDGLLNSYLKNLEDEVLNIYREEMKNHEGVLHRIHRHRRETSNSNDLVPVLAQNLWRSYTDTGATNREGVKVERLEYVGSVGSVKITHYFPLYLTDLPALYKGEDGLSYNFYSGSLEIVEAHNEWTANTTGCPCGETGSQRGQSHESCACCGVGNCLCEPRMGYEGDACVPCGAEPFLCRSAGPKAIEMDAAVGFQYVTTEQKLRHVVVTAKGETITFYNAIGRDFVPVRLWNGLNSITFGRPITHLGYGEALTDFCGILKKRRFIISFTAGFSQHRLQEVNINQWDSTLVMSSPQSWKAEGTLMTVSQVDAEAHIFVQEGLLLKVYKLKEQIDHQMTIQQIQTLSFPTPLIKSWSTLNTDFEYFLLVVTSEQLVVFVFNHNLYEHFQVIEPSHGVEVFGGAFPFYLTSCTSEAMVIAGHGSRAAIYSFSGPAVDNNFKVIYSTDLPIDIVDWSQGFSYRDASEKDIQQLVFLGAAGLSICSIFTRVYNISDPVAQHSQTIDITIRQIQSEYSRQVSAMQRAQDMLSSSIDHLSDVRGNVTITHSLEITQKLNTNGLIADNVAFSETNIDGIRPSLSPQYFGQIKSIQDNLHNKRTILTAIETSLEDAVLLNQTTRRVTGYKTIVTPYLHLGKLQSDVVVIREPADHARELPLQLPYLLKGLLRSGDTGSKILGKKTFTGEIRIEHLHPNFLDEIAVADLVTLHSKQSIAGATYLGHLSIDEVLLEPGATVGQLDLSEAVLLGEGFALGHVILARPLTVEGNLDTFNKIVNGFNMERMYENALQLSGGVISSHLVFTQDLAVFSLDAKVIMNIDTRQFLNNTIFKNQNAILNGTLTVLDNHLSIDKNLYAGLINGISFPGRYLIKTGSDPIIFSRHRRFNNVKFNNVKFDVYGLIDGVPLNNLITKSTRQDIIGGKSFALGVFIEKDLDIAFQTIGGVNMKENLTSVNQSVNPTFENVDIVFTKAVELPQLNYGGNLNGLNFLSLAVDIVYSDLNTVRIARNKRFSSGVIISNVHVNILNGEDMHTLVISSGNQELSGAKAFQSDVRYSTLTADLIDGVRIDVLTHTAIYLEGPNQVITGNKIFTKPVIVNFLNTSGTISKVDFSKVLTCCDRQVFLAPQTFDTATFSTLEIRGISLYDGFIVNGFDISELYKRRVPLKSPVNHNGTLIISGPVSTIGTLSATYINDYNINDLQVNVVTDDKNSTIDGTVVVSSFYVDGRVASDKTVGVNGLSISRIASNAVKIHNSNIFIGSSVFNELELRGDITVGGLVNGINVAELRDDAVSISSIAHQTIKGKKTFINGLYVKGDIITEKTNNIDLSAKLFTRHTDQRIISAFKFSDINTANDVFLSGFFREIDMRKLNQGMIKKTKAHLQGSIAISGNVSVRDLEIQGSLNDVPLQERFAAAVKTGVREAITGKKIFISETRFRDLGVNLFNGFTDVVLKDAAASLPGQWTVNGFVSSPWVTANHLSVEGTVDGEDYKRLRENAIYRRHRKIKIIQINLIFEESLVVKGNIIANALNGWSLNEDYLTTETDQSLMTAASFLGVTTGFINVDGKVNSFQLPFEQSISVRAVDGQVLTGPRIVTGGVKVLRNVEVMGLIGRDARYKLFNEVIDLTDSTQVSGFHRFTAPLVTSHLTSITNQINGIDVSRLYDQAWFVDQPTTITGRINFQGPAIMKAGLTSQGVVDNFNVAFIHQQASVILSTFDNYTEHFKEEYRQMCSQVVMVYELLEDSVYEGKCFEPLYHHSFPSLHRASATFNMFNRTYLVMTFEGQCSSEVYLWSEVTGTFEYYQTLESTGSVQQWLVIKENVFNNEVFLAAAASSSFSNCGDPSTALWKVTKDSVILFQLLLPGKGVSYEPVARGSLLHVYGLQNTITYTYLHDLSEWVETSRSSIIDFGTSVISSDGRVVSFWSVGGECEVRIGAVSSGRLRLGQRVLDALIFDHHGRLHLILYIAVGIDDCPTYFLKLYDIIHGGALHCLDVVTLSAPGKLTSFFVGNDACGSLYIVVAQYKLRPLIYTLQGDELSLWLKLNTPYVTWIQHFSIATRRFPSIVNHYLLLGQYNNNRALVVFLAMKGSTVPEKKGKCEVAAFISPRLTEAIHVEPSHSVDAISPPSFISSLSELFKPNSKTPVLHVRPNKLRPVSFKPLHPFIFPSELQATNATVTLSQNTTNSLNDSKGETSVKTNLDTLSKSNFLTNLSSLLEGNDNAFQKNQFLLNSSTQQNQELNRISGLIEQNPTSVLTEQQSKSILTEQHPKSVLTEQPPPNDLVEEHPNTQTEQDFRAVTDQLSSTTITAQQSSTIPGEPDHATTSPELQSSTAAEGLHHVFIFTPFFSSSAKPHSITGSGEQILRTGLTGDGSVSVSPEQGGITPSAQDFLIHSEEKDFTTPLEEQNVVTPSGERNVITPSKEQNVVTSSGEQNVITPSGEQDFTTPTLEQHFTSSSTKQNSPTTSADHNPLTSAEHHLHFASSDQKSTTATSGENRTIVLAEKQSTLTSEIPTTAALAKHSTDISEKHTPLTFEEDHSTIASGKHSTTTSAEDSNFPLAKLHSNIASGVNFTIKATNDHSTIASAESAATTSAEKSPIITSGEKSFANTSGEESSIIALAEDNSVTIASDGFPVTSAEDNFTLVSAEEDSGASSAVFVTTSTADEHVAIDSARHSSVGPVDNRSSIDSVGQLPVEPQTTAHPLEKHITGSSTKSASTRSEEQPIATGPARGHTIKSSTTNSSLEEQVTVMLSKESQMTSTTTAQYPENAIIEDYGSRSKGDGYWKESPYRWSYKEGQYPYNPYQPAQQPSGPYQKKEPWEEEEVYGPAHAGVPYDPYQKGAYPPIDYQKGKYPALQYLKEKYLPPIHYEKGEYPALIYPKEKYPTSSSEREKYPSRDYQKEQHLSSLGKEGQYNSLYWHKKEQNGDNNLYPKGQYNPKYPAPNPSWVRVYEGEKEDSSSPQTCGQNSHPIFRPHPEPCNPFRPSRG